MKRQAIIKTLWIIYLIAAVIFLINAMAGFTGYVVVEGANVGLSTIFALIFIAATVLLILYSKTSKKKLKRKKK